MLCFLTVSVLEARMLLFALLNMAERNVPRADAIVEPSNIAQIGLGKHMATTIIQKFNYWP